MRTGAVCYGKRRGYRLVELTQAEAQQLVNVLWRINDLSREEESIVRRLAKQLESLDIEIAGGRYRDLEEKA